MSIAFTAVAGYTLDARIVPDFDSWDGLPQFIARSLKIALRAEVGFVQSLPMDNFIHVPVQYELGLVMSSASRHGISS
jgi:hypothetical protein